jgi:PAS domain S-box-containing protein
MSPSSHPDRDEAAFAGEQSDPTALLHLLIEQVVDYAIFVMDADGKVATWNPGAERMKGYTPREIIGQPYEIFFPQEERLAGRPRQILSAVRSASRFEEEGWRVRKDGTRFWASVVVTALRDRAGKLRGFAKITRDLTARLRAEEEARRAAADRAARHQAELDQQEIRRSRDQLDLILRSIGEGVIVQSALDEGLVFVNEVAARLCGYQSAEEMLSEPREGIIGRFDLFRDDGSPFPAAELPGRLALEGKASSAVIRFRAKRATEERWSFVSAAPVFDVTGKPEFAVSVLREFTDRKRTEKAWQFLARASAILGSSLDHESTLKQIAQLAVPDIADWCAVELVGADGDLRQVAAAHVDPAKVALAAEWRRRWPPAAGSAVQRVASTGIPELIPEITPQVLAASARDDEQRRVVLELGLCSAMVVPLMVGDKPMGALSFLAAESGRRYGDDDLVLAIEVARRASLAVENARAYTATRAAVQVRDNFLAIASHELRTPLSALSVLMTSMLRASNQGRLMALGEKGVGDRLLKAERQLAQLNQLVDKLLDVSRLSSGDLHLELAPTDLAEIAREVVTRFEDAARDAGTAIELKVGTGTSGRWDRTRIDQVVTNLVSNAIKYAPGAPMTISVGSAGPERVRLVLRDRGPGIPLDDQKRIFGQFERGGGSTGAQGMGLGLWIVRRTVAAHGGAVTLDSVPGQGATFTITLPVEPMQ